MLQETKLAFNVAKYAAGQNEWEFVIIWTSYGNRTENNLFGQNIVYNQQFFATWEMMLSSKPQSVKQAHGGISGKHWNQYLRQTQMEWFYCNIGPMLDSCRLHIDQGASRYQEMMPTSMYGTAWTVSTPYAQLATASDSLTVCLSTTCRCRPVPRGTDVYANC